MPTRTPLAAGCAIVFIALVALGILGVIGFFSIGGLIKVHEQSALMARAQPVDATIVSAEVRRDVVRHTSSTRSRSTSTTTITYIPEVRYSYAIAGAEHTAAQVYTFPRNGAESWARSVVAQFPPGAQVTAYADPAHPGRAFLIRAWVPDPYRLVYTGAGCFAILTSMAALATFYFPRISNHIALVGACISFAVIAYAAAHYWTHVGFASSTRDWLALGALATPALPFLSLLLAKGWRRKFGAAIKAARE